MNAKEKIRNDILVSLRLHLNREQMSILDEVIVRVLQDVEVVELETLPATADNTNQYIYDLFMARKAPNLSDKTVECYMQTVKEFLLIIEKPLNKVTEFDIEKFMNIKRKRGNSPVTINNARRNLSSFFKWMRKVKLISENPCDYVDPLQEIKKPIDHMEAVHWDILKNGCKYKRDRALIEFLRCTAMRVGEVPDVNICDIDFRQGKLLIYGHKGKKYRTVLLDDVAIKYIKDYLDERRVSETSREPLFTWVKGYVGTRLSQEGIYSAVKAIAKRSGIDKNIYPHLFRKTTATNICRRGGTEEQAGEYLGHAPKGVTGNHYTYKGDESVEKIFKDFVSAV